MSEMKFRCLIDNTLCDIMPFKSYAEKGDFDLGLVLIGFSEKETEKIRQLFKDNVREGYESYLNNIQLEGSDGNLYIMSQTSVDKKEKMPHSIMKAYKYYYSYKKKENKSKQWIKENTAKKRIDDNLGKNEEGIVKHFGGNYRYIDKENEMCFPFRLYKSKKADRPLFILFHGAGALGNENIKHLFDHIPLFKQILKCDCNILMPQAPYGANRGGDVLIERYIKSVKKLIDELPIDFDRKRIYIAGTSFGGFCVWHMAYHFPEYFAAGVPVMGGLYFDSNFGSYDMQRLVSTPLWVAHSADDMNVRIDSDDYCVKELEKLGADIKYTRWTKYGHSMYKRFYKNEKWAEWCMSKELK
ncbi:MAG: prolyl oligopeptidase family serine peptidase [Clostridia bacterium]|nr:prolyl oligopeptidase family serine peptidase [Clostridia bacterium]